LGGFEGGNLTGRSIKNANSFLTLLGEGFGATWGGFRKGSGVTLGGFEGGKKARRAT